MRATHQITALAGAAMLAVHTPQLNAQQTIAGDSLSLGIAQVQAVAADPRGRQLELQARQSALRLRTLATSWYPALSINGQGQYQSDVTGFSAALPPNLHIPTQPHDTYDGHVNAQQPILDPTISPREALERTQLAESESQVRATLFGLRQEVNDAFFAAASLQARSTEVEIAMQDLRERLRDARDRVRGGTALPSDTAILAATLLQRQQDSLQLGADRHAALARLGDLIGRPVADDVRLGYSDLVAESAQASNAVDGLRSRPEYAQFAATRARLSTQETVDAAQDKPKLSAFGRWGYGRPGLNMLNTSFETYWLAGLQVQWMPWTWGSTSRDREVLALQRDIVTTNEAAFTRQIRRSIESDVSTIARLDSTLAADDRIIALRELVERETRIRFEEGVVTAADYTDRSTDLLTARLARAQHRIDLTQTRAHFLTTLGLEVH